MGHNKELCACTFLNVSTLEIILENIKNKYLLKRRGQNKDKSAFSYFYALALALILWKNIVASHVMVGADLLVSYKQMEFQFDSITWINVELVLCVFLIPESTLYLNPTLQNLASGLILIQ